MTFEVQIAGQGMVIDQQLDDYVTKKVSKLERYLNGIQEARVDLKHAETAREANDRYVAQITIRGKGFTLRVEERKDNIRSAIDSALDKSKRRIESYKGKRFNARGDGSSLATDALEAIEAEYAEEEVTEIARRKRFYLTPMDEGEALEQMKLLDHEDFFIFYNVATNSASVLYRRRDDSYGLIDTQLS